jgi:type IV secretion system protein VirB9
MLPLPPARCAGPVAAALVLMLAAAPGGALAAGPELGGDPRIREIRYDANAVVSIPVKRGVVTHLLLGADESITDVATGLGADCSKPDAAWCIAAQPGGRQVFIKPKSGANLPNTLAIATDKRLHTLKLVLLPDGDRREPLYRLQILAPRSAAPTAHRTAPTAAGLQPPHLLPDLLPDLTPFDELEGTAAAAVAAVADRLQDRLSAAPTVRNARYSLSEGKASEDIVPTAVWDDGRFTYFRFPANREVPAVFHVLPDGSETMVNARMEGDLLAIDRVSRHLVLRAGTAVIGVWNDAFDLDGVPAKDGTTVSGVRRALRPQPATSPVTPATTAPRPGPAAAPEPGPAAREGEAR